MNPLAGLIRNQSFKKYRPAHRLFILLLACPIIIIIISIEVDTKVFYICIPHSGAFP